MFLLKKPPHKYNSNPAKKYDLDITVNHLNSVTKKGTKAFLLSSDKPSNFNKKTNTLFVNPKDVRDYTLLKELSLIYDQNPKKKGN